MEYPEVVHVLDSHTYLNPTLTYGVSWGNACTGQPYRSESYTHLWSILRECMYWTAIQIWILHSPMEYPEGVHVLEGHTDLNPTLTYGVSWGSARTGQPYRSESYTHLWSILRECMYWTAIQIWIIHFITCFSGKYSFFCKVRMAR